MTCCHYVQSSSSPSSSLPFRGSQAGRSPLVNFMSKCAFHVFSVIFCYDFLKVSMWFALKVYPRGNSSPDVNRLV